MPSSDNIAQVTTLATQTATSVWGFASDFLIIIVLLMMFFFFARYIGRGPFVAILLAFYSAYALYSAFPFFSFLPTAPAITALAANLFLYGALVVLFYIILRRVVVSDFIAIGSFGLILLSFLGSAFLIALAYHVFSVEAVYHFTPAIATLFAPKQFFFWWFIAPAVGLFLLAR